MKYIKIITALICCLSILILSSCKGAENTSALKIGVSGIEGVFNPFYAESEADREIVSQMFRTIQRRNSDNKFVNSSGGISYEFVGENSIKYTVSINEDLYFSDGTNITIDDVIFFYHFIADATYDGVYSDWYLNDIAGLKEYYFDDKNYQSSISDIEYRVKEKYTVSNITTDDYVDYLFETKLEGRFNGDLDSESPYGSSWREYILKFGYAEAVEDLGNTPSQDRVTKLVARAEAETNPENYNPENWYRNKLYSAYIKDNYSDGTDVSAIEGIKKVDDYTCTVMFNSRNINAIAQLNAMLVSKAYLSAEYIKGSAGKIKDIDGYGVCSGAYKVTEYEDGVVSMAANEYYGEDSVGFSNLKFIELSEKADPIKQVKSGKVDIVKTLATAENISALDDKNVRYFIENCDYYTSLFFNTRTLDVSVRKALIGICNVSGAVEGQIGSYYTRLLRPISVRFEEYPSSVTEPYFSESAFTVYSMGSGEKTDDISVYYAGAEGDLAYTVLDEYKKILSSKGILLKIVLTDAQGLENAVVSGKADMWIENVYDGDSCDKYDYYNSNGRYNKTGIRTSEIDSLTLSIRSAAGYSNKVKMTEQLMNLVMEQAVECPLYQLQTVTVYNTDTINPDSFSQMLNMDGYAEILPYLKRN